MGARERGKRMIIEDNIPMPTKKRGRKGGHIHILTDNMEVGDSVLLDEKQKADNIGRALRNKNFNAVVRTVEGGYRVWKLEEKNND